MAREGNQASIYSGVGDDQGNHQYIESLLKHYQLGDAFSILLISELNIVDWCFDVSLKQFLKLLKYFRYILNYFLWNMKVSEHESPYFRLVNVK